MLDNFRETAITWDKANRKVYEPLRVSAGDNKGRKLSVQLVNDGVIEDLSGASLSLFWETKDKAHKGLDAFTVVDATKGEFEIYYTTGMLSNEGTLNANLVLVDASGRIVSEPFTITVFKGIDDDAIQSSDSFTALTEALAQVSTINNKADRAELLAVEQQLQQKASINYVDALLMDIAKGGPKDLLLSRAELDIKYPDGIEGTVLVIDSAYTNGAHSFMWDSVNLEWIDLGVYQATGVANKSVTLSKLVLEGYLPMSIVYSPGRETGTDNRYVRADIPFLEKGATITALEDNIGFTVYYKQVDGTYKNLHLGWIKTFEMPDNYSDVRIAARLEPLRVITPTEKDLFSSWIEIVTSETAVKRKELSEKIKGLTKGYQLSYEFGDISVSGENVSTTERRIRNVEFVPVVAGTMIHNKDKQTLEVAVAYEDGNAFISSNGWSSEDYTVTRDLNVRIMVRKKDNSVFTTAEIASYADRIEIKGAETFATVPDLFRSTVKAKYVSLAGNDTFDGNSIESAYKTLQKALDSGAETIFIERGIYRDQSAAKSNVHKLSILPIGDSADLIEFCGSDELGIWTAHNSIYRTAYSGNSRFTQVFVDKTLLPETTGTRPSYNAVLWEGNNKETDYKMKPVLTLAECESEVGTFHYDGTHVYVNPYDIGSRFNAVKTDNGLTLSGDNITLKDVVFDYYTNDPMNLDNIKNLNAQNCGAHHSSTRDGWSLDYTSGEFKMCGASKNRNDGFNLHFTGNTVFLDCEGTNNYDDGISHHENCTGVIIGGTWSGNAKGGIIPVDNAKVKVYNAVIENNQYGFYTDKASLSQGNLYKGNVIAIKNNGDETLSINDAFVDNATETEGVVTRY